MELFFDPNFTGKGILCESESKHCINVLRHKADDIITIADGKGKYYKGKIITAHHKRCEIAHIETIEHTQPNISIHLAVAPTKNIDRFEWLIEKATELGISEITPLLCHHSERKKIRIDRIEKIAVAAMKQSLKAYVPIVNDLIPFEKFINKIDNNASFIAHCYKTEKESLKKAYSQQKKITLLIGPEGDFSEQEVKQAIQAGCCAVSLGSSRLRTETAGVVAVHTIHLMSE